MAFGCELGNSAWIVTWYKNQEKLQEDESITVDDEGIQLNITSASKAHNGEYACKAELEYRGVSSEFSNTKKVTVYGEVLYLKALMITFYFEMKHISANTPLQAARANQVISGKTCYLCAVIFRACRNHLQGKC